MKEPGEAKMLRIYVSNTDRFKHAPLYETIVFAAKRYGLAGATSLRGTMGFGSSSTVHTTKFWEISEKFPVVIEIVDEPEKVDWFVEKILPWFDKLPSGCMITTTDVKLILSKKGNRKTRETGLFG